MNIQSCIDEFMLYMEQTAGRSAHTITSYAGDLAQFADYLEGCGVSEPSGLDLALMRGFLRELSGFGFSKKSVARKLSALRGFSRFLVGRGWLASDVTAGLRGPSVRPGIPRAIAIEDVERMLAEGTKGNKKELRDSLALELLYASGLRVAELVGLNWDDVDIEERWLRVSGKGSKERMVPFGRRAQELLRAWRAKCAASGRPTDGDAPLFGGVGADRLTERTVHRIVLAAASRVGLAGVHPHSLRHSFATHMLERGAPLVVIQQLLGHESLATTQIYLTVTAEQMKKSYIKAHPRAGGDGADSEREL